MQKKWFFLGIFALMLGISAAGQKGKPYIAMIAKGEQHDFWQQVRKGSLAAAKELQIAVTFEGPATESDVQAQVEMLNGAIAKKPSAIGLAALDTKSVLDQLAQAKREGIPIIGFDSGVPEAPAGSILATVATNNYQVAGLAAEKMFEKVKDKIAATSEQNPATVVVFSQDSTSSSVGDRGRGFRDRMIELVAGLPGMSRDDIRVAGNAAFIAADSPTTGKRFIIFNIVSASSSITDASASASAMLSRAPSDNTLGVFASNELTAKAMLVASSEGAKLPASGLVVIGFDAGKAQKDAVRKNYFLGSVTQDPYDMGYKAVKEAYKAYKKEAVQDISTAVHFYTSANMDDENIKGLLYD